MNTPRKISNQLMSLRLVLALAIFGLGISAQAQGIYGPHRISLSDARLTGTFRLDWSGSDDPQRAAQLMTRTLSEGMRERVYRRILERLKSPDDLAIRRRGITITMASSRAPETTFIADGREQLEPLPNGRTTRSSASVYRDQLVVSSKGFRDSDFVVTFEPIGNGNRLRVTRQIFSEHLARPIVVRSLYYRVSERAQFDRFNGGSRELARADWNGSRGGPAVREGEVLAARLDTFLSTRSSREGDTFTLTVLSPPQYEGAAIVGTVSRLNRSGRVSGRSEMMFNFDTIRLPNGESHSFDGVIEGVSTPSGERLGVDVEGGVRDRSQSYQTVERAAIGGTVGAIIGAIAGGGKGAAIGAAVGAGAGAGSVYVQGRDDLDLENGSIVTIRTLR